MKVIVFYSGGICSYLAAKRCVAEYGKDEVLLYFNDVSYEHKTLYKFLFDGAKKLGCKLYIDKDGRTPFDVFAEGMMGNTRLDPCSHKLKRERSHKFMKDISLDVKVALGFSWDEMHRLEGAKQNYKHEAIAPMTEAPYLTKTEMIKEVENDGLEIPYLYNIGMSHNNCGGFCIKAGQAHYAQLLRADEKLYLYHERRELDAYSKIGKTRPFLRMTIKGEIKYLTLQQFRKHIEAQGQYDLFDYGGCGCYDEDKE